jgi:hypothetical protein
MNKQPTPKILSRLDNDGTFNVTIEFRFAADTYAADEALLAQGRKIFCQDFNVKAHFAVAPKLVWLIEFYQSSCRSLQPISSL